MFIFIGGILYYLDPVSAYLWEGSDLPPNPPGIDAPDNEANFFIRLLIR